MQVPLSMRIIELLHKEGLIAERSKMSAERSAGHLTSITDILKCVSEDHSKMRTLGSILTQSEVRKSLGQKLLLEYYSKRHTAKTLFKPTLKRLPLFQKSIACLVKLR